MRHDGRANPCQLVIGDSTWEPLARLRDELVAAHEAALRQGRGDDLVVGLQLTHSGPLRAPDRLGPARSRSPPSPTRVLDRRFPGGVRVLTDEDLDHLVEDFVRAAVLAQRAGFHFVDVKHCHGYLRPRAARRARPARAATAAPSRTAPGSCARVVEGIRAEAPGLRIGVRFSAFDIVPSRQGETGRGERGRRARYTSRIRRAPDDRMDAALAERHGFLRVLRARHPLVCVTGGSPYYNPHVQRPALFPPTDGYQPPEDPLVGVARQSEHGAA